MTLFIFNNEWTSFFFFISQNRGKVWYTTCEMIPAHSCMSLSFSYTFSLDRWVTHNLSDYPSIELCCHWGVFSFSSHLYFTTYYPNKDSITPLFLLHYTSPLPFHGVTFTSLIPLDTWKQNMLVSLSRFPWEGSVELHRCTYMTFIIQIIKNECHLL